MMRCCTLSLGLVIKGNVVTILTCIYYLCSRAEEYNRENSDHMNKLQEFVKESIL